MKHYDTLLEWIFTNDWRQHPEHPLRHHSFPLWANEPIIVIQQQPAGKDANGGLFLLLGSLCLHNDSFFSSQTCKYVLIWQTLGCSMLLMDLTKVLNPICEILCVCSGCSRAVNVVKNGILCTPVTWSTSRLLLMHPVPSPVPPWGETPPPPQG